MNPGWYPDPYSSGYLRWWDGAQWTAHTAPTSPMAPMGGYGSTPQKDLADELRAGRRASIAVIVGAVAGVAQMFGMVWVFRNLRHDLMSNAFLGRSTAAPDVAGLGFVELIGIAAIVVQIFVMIWLYRTATLARRAGLPARREAFWAIVGFLVPIVNFWFPYQVAADSFAPGDPRRPLAARWWTWYLTSTVGGVVVVFVVAAFSSGAALVCALLAAIAYALQVVYARRLIEALGSAHGELVRALADR